MGNSPPQKKQQKLILVPPHMQAKTQDI